MGANRHKSVDSRGRYTPEVSGVAMPGAEDSEGPPGSRSHNPFLARRASLMQEPVLVLNATYEPINVTAVRRAMVLMLKGVAQAEEMHNTEVHSAAHAHKVPSVIRLLAYRHIPQQSRALSRKNILLRDRNAFQLGEFGGLLLPVQQQQGRPYAGGGWAETGAETPAVYAAHLPAAHAAYRAPG